MHRPSALLLPLALCACARADTLSVSNAWVRLAAVAGRPAAGYFALHGGPSDATLVRVESPAAGRVELHQSMRMDGAGMGAMTMRPLATVAVPAGGEVAFAPGGRHLMLFDIAPALTPGATLPLRFVFADGRTFTTDARIVAAGDAAPAR